MKKVCFLFVVLVVCLVVVSVTMAEEESAVATVRLVYTGVVTRIRPELPHVVCSDVQIGDQVSGSFSYRTDLEDLRPGEPNIALYRPLTAFSMSMGQISFPTSNDLSELQVSNDYGGPYDSIGASASSSSVTAYVEAYSRGDLTQLDSIAPPLKAISFDDSFFLMWKDEPMQSGHCQYVGNLLTFTLHSVTWHTYPVSIDIKPGSDPNCFNNDGHGVIPVAVLTTDTFDAATVDPFTVTLDDREVRVKGKSGNAGSLEDVDNDGDLDLVMQIVDIDGTYQEGDTFATLTGETYDGTLIEGQDSICIVP